MSQRLEVRDAVDPYKVYGTMEVPDSVDTGTVLTFEPSGVSVEVCRMAFVIPLVRPELLEAPELRDKSVEELIWEGYGKSENRLALKYEGDPEALRGLPGFVLPPPRE